jgi:hypothetical protein
MYTIFMTLIIFLVNRDDLVLPGNVLSAAPLQLGGTVADRPASHKAFEKWEGISETSY